MPASAIVDISRDEVIQSRQQRRQNHRARRYEAFEKMSHNPWVLGMIFVHCLPGDGFARPNRTNAPLHLTHVCRYWRQIARTTPELWSGIRLKSRIFNVDTALMHTEILDHWLTLSKACSFSFHITYTQIFSPEILNAPFGFVYPIISKLTECAHRWRNINIGGHSVFVFSMLRCLAAPLKELESITIDLPGDRISSSRSVILFPPPFRIDTANMPKLRRFYSRSETLRFVWTGIPPRLETLSQVSRGLSLDDSFSFNLGVLRRLTLIGTVISCMTLLTISRAAPSLRSLHITVTGSTGFSDVGVHDLISFPDLRHLRLEDWEGPASVLLDKLHTPSLMSLHFATHSDNINPNPCLLQLAALIQRSMSPLRVLKIFAGGCREEDLLSVLRVVPEVLIELTVLEVSMTDSTLQTLTRSQAPTETCICLCPYLRSLTLRCQNPFRMYSASELIKSRMGGVADVNVENISKFQPLQHCSLMVDNADLLADDPDIHRYIEEGRLKLIHNIWDL